MPPIAKLRDRAGLPFDSITGQVVSSAVMVQVNRAITSGRSGNQVIRRNPSASHCVKKLPLETYRPESSVFSSGAIRVSISSVNASGTSATISLSPSML